MFCRTHFILRYQFAVCCVQHLHLKSSHPHLGPPQPWSGGIWRNLSLAWFQPIKGPTLSMVLSASDGACARLPLRLKGWQPGGDWVIDVLSNAFHPSLSVCRLLCATSSSQVIPPSSWPTTALIWGHLKELEFGLISTNQRADPFHGA